MLISHSLALSLAFLHGAQGTSPEAPDPITSLEMDRSQLYYAPGDEGALWVRGRTYKASVDAEGFTYVPFLGSDAPKNFPVRFELVEATLGGAALSLASTAEVHQIGDRWVLDRGAVEVRYDLALESVEQSFRVDTTGSSGPLELVLLVQTELGHEPFSEPAHADLSFSRAQSEAGREAQVGVRYGAAFVLDGADRSSSIKTRFDGHRLHLTVPADFIRRAGGPILVDPVISTYGVSTVLGDQRDVDMAYDLDADAFLYAFEEEFSGSDTDVVVMQRRASNGAFLGSSYFDLSGNVYKDPSVANLNAHDRSLVVAIQTAGATGSTGSLYGAIFAHPTGLGAKFAIDTGGFSSKGHPDVGGCASSDPSSVFMVVWERYWWGQDRTSIAARSVAYDGTLGPIEDVAPISSFSNYTRPAISKSSGHAAAADTWTCAYIAGGLSPTAPTRVRATKINRSAQIMESMFTALLPSTELVTTVDISEEQASLDGPKFAVVMGTRNAGQERIRLTVNWFPDASFIRTLSLFEHSDENRQLSEPHIATQDRRFQVSYLHRVGNNATAYLSGFDTSKHEFIATEELRTRLAFVGGVFHDRGGVAIASKYGGGDFSSRLSGLAWESAGSETDLIGATHRSQPSLAIGLPYCIGEPNSTGQRGYISVFGGLSLTSPKTLVAGSVPAGSLGMFLISDNVDTGPGGVALPGGLCLSSPVGRIMPSVGTVRPDGTWSYTLDPTDIPMPGGAVSAMLGDLFAFQFWHRDSVGGSSTFNLTNATQMYFWP